jgi:hypothetical protein
MWMFHVGILSSFEVGGCGLPSSGDVAELHWSEGREVAVSNAGMLRVQHFSCQPLPLGWTLASNQMTAGREIKEWRREQTRFRHERARAKLHEIEAAAAE